MISSWESRSIFKQRNFLEGLWLRLSELTESKCWRKGQPSSCSLSSRCRCEPFPQTPLWNLGEAGGKLVSCLFYCKQRLRESFLNIFLGRQEWNLIVLDQYVCFEGISDLTTLSCICSWHAYMIFLKPKHSNQQLGKAAKEVGGRGWDSRVRRHSGDGACGIEDHTHDKGA